MTKYEGRETGFASGDPDGDWFSRMMINDQAQYAVDIDTREYNRPFGTYFYEQLGITGVGAAMVMTSYENIMIIKDGAPHFNDTDLANVAQKFGCPYRAVIDEEAGVRVNQEILYQSDSIPSIWDGASSFVRLDNFPQNSYNAAIGRPSQILYHMPRFDQSSREMGQGLFFEPAERVYCKLNNSDTIKINELQLSICQVDEVLQEDISGQTIIILTFRTSKSPIEKGSY